MGNILFLKIHLPLLLEAMKISTRSSSALMMCYSFERIVMWCSQVWVWSGWNKPIAHTMWVFSPGVGAGIWGDSCGVHTQTVSCTETATDMNKWNMFCNLYSHECDELGGSHLGLHTPKGCKDTSTPWKVLKPRCWGYSDGQMSFQTPSLCSHVCALQAK